MWRRKPSDVKYYEQVRRNDGSSGFNKQSVGKFGICFSNNYKEFQSEILNDTYTPESVKVVRISKP